MGVGQCETGLEIQEGMVLLTCSCCCSYQDSAEHACARARVCMSVCVFRSSSGNNSVKNSGPATELGTRVEL